MNTTSDVFKILERRFKPRFKSDYPTRIRGYDENGKLFEEDGRAINLSRSGVYVLLHREIQTGCKLSIRIAFPTGLIKLGTTKLALHGLVVRGEIHSDSIFGIAVQFEEYRFI